MLLPWLVPMAPAFAPTAATGGGMEPRVQHARPAEQARLLRGEAFRAFAATDGMGWQARFDEVTGTPRWLWGRGIPMDTSSPAALSTGVEALVGRHPALFGVDPSDVRPRSARYSAPYDTWYVDLDVLRDPTAPTWRGGISARVKHGNLVLLVVATAPRAPVTGAWTIDTDAAVDAAVAQGPAPDVVHAEPSVERRLLEIEGRELRRTLLVRTRTADPPGRWVSFVDAETGELLSAHNEVRFATGTVSGLHHARSPDGSPLVTSGLPLAFVDTAGGTATTDDLGVYTIADAATYTTGLEGEWLDVVTDVGVDAQLASAAPDILWTDGSATQAEIDSYVFLHHVRDWGLAVAPDVEMSVLDLVSHVNVPGYFCNAYYDGDVHFFDAGYGCADAAEVADIEYHEWGHGFHYYSVESGFVDGSLGEGASDCVAFFQTGDSRIAPDFLPFGGPIRDVAPDKVYPQDYSASYYYVHDNGLIFGGAVWDLWDILQDDLGPEAGTAAAESIFAGLLKGGPDIPGSYWEAIVADDDNGDLADGTPNLCSITDAFSRHGLGSFDGGSLFAPVHDPVASVASDVPVDLVFEVLGGPVECIDTAPDRATIHYRLDGGSWEDLDATVGASVVATLPPLPFGSFLEYWLDGYDVSDNAFVLPPGGERAPYTAFVGDTLELWCEDFEAGDGGLAHAAVEAGAVDDWAWGAPQGLGGDPAAAASGSKVWGTDLGDDDGLYESSTATALEAPPVDTAHYTGVFLSYRRWLTIEDGRYDSASITFDGEPVWTSHASVTGGEDTIDEQWMAHVVPIAGVGQEQQLTLGFELSSDGGGEHGGWTLDDVCLLAPASVDNRLAILDFEARDSGGPVALSWTNPTSDTLDRVVVAKRVAAWTETWEDGDVVVDLGDPIPGVRVEVEDPDLAGAGGYYAVYASDGVGWLSWTIEGWNAAFVPGQAANPTVPTTAPPEKKGGCGCASAPAPVAWLGLVLVVVVRRPRA